MSASNIDPLRIGILIANVGFLCMVLYAVYRGYRDRHTPPTPTPVTQSAEQHDVAAAEGPTVRSQVADLGTKCINEVLLFFLSQSVVLMDFFQP